MEFLNLTLKRLNKKKHVFHENNINQNINPDTNIIVTLVRAHIYHFICVVMLNDLHV